MKQSGRDGDDADLAAGDVEHLRGLLRARKCDGARDEGKDGTGKAQFHDGNLAQPVSGGALDQRPVVSQGYPGSVVRRVSSTGMPTVKW